MQRTAFMTVTEVAETLGISKSHAYKMGSALFSRSSCRR